MDHRYTEKQIDGYIGKQIDRLGDIQVGRYIDGQMEDG